MRTNVAFNKIILQH